MNLNNLRFPHLDFFLHAWRPYLWLSLVGFMLYLPIVTFSDYTYYDDYFLIVDNFSSIDAWSDAGHAFLEDVSHQKQGGNLYRPLLTLSLILSANISGTMPLGFHLTDILLHCLSCCLLFQTFQILGFKRSHSFLATLLFCVHPANTQAVAWIAGRNDSLLAIFILSSFITFSKYVSTASMKWFFLHVLCFALAIFTKESAILFPFLALFYSLGLKKEKLFSLTTVLFLLAWGIILVNWNILRSAALITPVGDRILAAKLVLSNFWIAWSYFGKIFWPFKLSFAPISADIQSTAGVISGGLLLLVLLLSERKDWKIILFGALWFLAFLIPTFYYDLAVHTPPKFYEHRIYLPFMGILFILLSLSLAGRLRQYQRLFPPLYLFLFISLGWMSFSHAFDFKNSLTLSEYDTSTSPHDPRRFSKITRMAIPEKLAQEIKTVQNKPSLQVQDSTIVSREELWRIIQNLKNELRLSPLDPELHHSLAISYFAYGLFLSSEKHFLAARQEKPRDATIPYNLGILYYSAQPIRKAEKEWLEALQLDPSMGKAHLNLSFLYYELAQNKLAWLHCQQAKQLGIQMTSEFENEIRKKL
jgi:protein O-mannosyl-transferase